LVKQERPPKAITSLKNTWPAFCLSAKTNESVSRQKAHSLKGSGSAFALRFDRKFLFSQARLIALFPVTSGEPAQSDGGASPDERISSPEVTRLLSKWSQGDPSALEKLTPLVYDELRRLAHRYMSGERSNHTLQTTALVNEAYLKFARQTDPNWSSRAHFFAVAAQAMRQILINYALSYNAQKRGGGGAKVELDEAALVSAAQSREIVELHEALERLGQLDARKAEVVELKYFGGLKEDEIAEALGISAVTVRREWRFAKAWLHNELHAA
jgi:RNA polymerase sigma factor (TIGR02999 family)